MGTTKISTKTTDYDRYHDFNVTKRLEEIFPLIDLDQNGLVSREELRIWHYAQARNHSENRAEHEFDVTDNDHDGFVTLKEYLEDDFDVDVTGNGTEKEWRSTTFDGYATRGKCSS